MPRRQPPAFQFYVKDWLSSTKLLSAEAKGAYIDMLAYSWDNGPIPNTRAALAGAAGLTPAAFARVWPLLSKKWSRQGRFRVNKRLELQRASAEKFSAQQAARGRLSGFVRSTQRNQRSFPVRTGEEPETNSALCSLQSADQEPRAACGQPVENSPPEHARVPRADTFLATPIVRRHLLRAAYAELDRDPEAPPSVLSDAVKDAAAQLRCEYDAGLVGTIVRAACGARGRA